MVKGARLMKEGTEKNLSITDRVTQNNLPLTKFSCVYADLAQRCLSRA